MKTPVYAIAVLGLVLSAASANAYSAYSTGIDMPLGKQGAPSWTVEGAGLTGAQNVVNLSDGELDFPYQYYAKNDAQSKWVSFAEDGGYEQPAGETEGIYTYSTQVDFTGSTGVLSGHFWADDSVLGIFVDGVNLGLDPITSHSHGMNSSFWSVVGADFELAGYSGAHTLSFQIRNGLPGSDMLHNATAFRGDIHMMAVPEPFTMSLGVASVGLFLRRRLKSRRL